MSSWCAFDLINSDLSFRRASLLDHNASAAVATLLKIQVVDCLIRRAFGLIRRAFRLVISSSPNSEVAQGSIGKSNNRGDRHRSDRLPPYSTVEAPGWYCQRHRLGRCMSQAHGQCHMPQGVSEPPPNDIDKTSN